MNTVSPSATQYGSPESRRRKNLSARRDAPQMGYQGAGRDGATDEVDKLKSKLLTAWHSVKYGWTVKMKTHFNRSTPLYLLGKHYSFRFDDDIERFQQDFVSRVWLTYRRDFPALEGTQLTTDCGWGCMIRSAQMLLAQALLMHLLCRDWLWPEALDTIFVDMEPMSSPPTLNSFSSTSSPTSHSRHLHSHTLPAGPHGQLPHQGHIHRDILRWLSDHPDAPYGLHHMVKLGGSFGKKAGDWYGPSIVAHILRKALEASPQVPGLSVYVSQDCTVYRADVEQLLGPVDPRVDTTGDKGRAVIILIPVRLGGENFNPVYKHCIKEFLQMPSCLGIIGGKPKHSLYFIGYQDNHLLYLDPHYSQTYVDTSADDFPLDTFHCNAPRKMSIVKMDPSCTIAFYARNGEDFRALCNHLSKVLSSPSAEEKYPVFSISEGHAQELHGSEVLPLSTYTLTHRNRSAVAQRPGSDEFEFL